MMQSSRNQQSHPSGFARIAGTASRLAGSPFAFVMALGVVVLWGVTGPLFRFSDTWQLVINTGTTIATFLLGFLIQYMQNRTGEKTDRVLEHLDKLVSVDHAEHGRLLREIHSHTRCAGHTVIETASAIERRLKRDPQTGRFVSARR